MPAGCQYRGRQEDLVDHSLTLEVNLHNFLYIYVLEKQDTRRS